MNFKRWLQKRTIGYLTKNLFHALTPEDVLNVGQGLKLRVMFKGKELNADQLITIKENAENFEKSLLWLFMENRIRQVSQEKMFPLSQVDTDLIFGKAMLYNLDVIKQVLKDIRDIKT